MKNILFVAFIVFSNLLCHGQLVRVSRVIDGDTFVIETGEKVRLIGINAPEISDLHGLDAKSHLERLISNNKIELILDKVSKDRDRYSRLLRYAYVHEIDINKQMIADGYAIAYLKFKFEKREAYRLAQIGAEKSGARKSGMQFTDSNSELISDNSTFNWGRKKIVVVCLGGFLIFLGLFYRLKK